MDCGRTLGRIVNQSKEEAMKTKQMLFAAGLLAATLAPGAQAQDSSYFGNVDCSKIQKVEKAKKNFLMALSSENDGLVEAALSQVAYLALKLPECRPEEIRAAVGSLSVVGRTPAIRYKAYLALLVFENPEMFSAQRGGLYASDTEFFLDISRQVQKTLVGDASRKLVRAM
jgi:hypothetical protein